jgi:MEMO1 family protein
MREVRPAAVAGMFYPGSASRLAGDVEAMLDEVRQVEGPAPKALVVPHAGYVYSGPVAAHAYARLAPVRDVIRRVVLLGPAHRVAVRGLAVPALHAFATPLGIVDVDRDALAEVADLPQVVESDRVHADEHSLEVQLPFLQRTLARFSVAPFAVGDATPGEVAAVLDRLWGGTETLIVISTDLSHYHRYADARDLDRATAARIAALEPVLGHEDACGATPVNGFLRCARGHGLEAELLDLRNSGDTAGDRSRVVGYAAFAFNAPGHRGAA